MGKNKDIKKGDVVINHKHEDNIAAIHPLLHLTETKAAVMTSKQANDRMEVDEEWFSGFKIKEHCYVTPTVVENSEGVVIGKIKKGNFLNKVINFISRNKDITL